MLLIAGMYITVQALQVIPSILPIVTAHAKQSMNLVVIAVVEAAMP